MKVITVNGTQYVAANIATEKGVTSIEGAMQFGGSELTGGTISSYLQSRNVGALSNMQLNGMQSYTTRDLTAAENIAVKHAEAQFNLAKDHPDIVARLKKDMQALAKDMQIKSR